ncbi:hypothetical protein F5B22DRAFT_427407 [Xylaria bambusicola]|uniref:uncharacterized protein n=1 Tax=Xylaria bambusicola TaxID=326684 RepID=UPI002007FE59|nr:uncharacterized protein F5B22DRAFT_427407 [Xylaria bambusicola]KAI0506897.1 hypothetical protein F5B22DRAFT_427407 [Xylaria bambusicola]
MYLSRCVCLQLTTTLIHFSLVSVNLYSLCCVSETTLLPKIRLALTNDLSPAASCISTRFSRSSGFANKRLRLGLNLQYLKPPVLHLVREKGLFIPWPTF